MAANPWLQGSESVLESWREAQQQLWAGWSELSEHVGGAQAKPLAGALGEWQRLSEASLKAWQGDALSKSVAERMVAGQGLFLNVLEQTAEAWQAVLPKLAQGDAQEDWQASLEGYREAMLERLRAWPDEFLETSTESNELFTTYVESLNLMSRAWLEPETGVPDEAVQLMDRFWSAFDKTLGRALQSPTMGYSREFNAKLAAAFTSWLELRRADAEYQTHVTTIWGEALEALMKTLIERSRAGQPPVSAKDFLNVWISVADEVFVRAFATEDYIAAQGKMLNASMSHRLRERAVQEAIMDGYGLPTRTELDETQASLYELRREVRGLRGLRRDLEALKAESRNDELAALKAEVSALRKALKDQALENQALENHSQAESALERNLPVADYVTLSVNEVLERAEGLSRYELEHLRAFELLHKSRKTLLAELDRRLQSEGGA